MFSCRFIQGMSSQTEWFLDQSAQGERRIIGSAPPAEWIVQAAGVLPAHVEIFFDGQAIWICDLAQRGDVRLNGTVVGEWQAVPAKSQITFGAATLEVLAAQKPLERPAGPSSAGHPGFAVPQASPPMTFSSTVISTNDPLSGDAQTRPDAPPPGAYPTGSSAKKRTMMIGGAAAAVIVVIIAGVLLTRSRGTGPVALPATAPGMEAPPPAAPAVDMFPDVAPTAPAADKDLVAMDVDAGTAEVSTATAPPSADDPNVTPEARAALMVFHGRYKQAIPLYESLAKENPTRQEFPIVVAVLRRALAKTCINGVGPGGEPCEK